MRTLDYVILFVADLERSTAFYRDVLGLEHVFTDAGYAEFSAGETRFALYEKRRAEWLTGHPARPGPAGELVLTVDDVDDAASRLRTAGVRLLAPPTDRPWGHRTAHVADPDGFVVEVAQRIARSRHRRQAEPLVATLDTSAVTVCAARDADAAEFVAGAAASHEALAPWAFPPRTPETYDAWLHGPIGQQSVRFLVRSARDGGLAGFVSVQNIVRGAYRSGTLGYGGFTGYTGRGLMSAGVAAVVRCCFAPEPDGLGLHRVEANVRPENHSSLRLVRRLGFRHEGYSPRLLFLDGAWRDHERFALTAEDLTTEGTSPAPRA